MPQEVEQMKQPVVSMPFLEYLKLITKAAKCDRLVEAFEKEGKTA